MFVIDQFNMFGIVRMSFRVSKTIKVPTRQAQRNNEKNPIRQVLSPQPFFTFSHRDFEEQSGIAQIQKWLDLADTVLAAPARRKTE